MKLLAFFALIALAVATPEEDVAVVKQAQSVLFKETGNLGIALGGPQIKLPERSDFEAYKTQFGKQYGSPDEEDIRYQIFRVNHYLAATYQLLEMGTATYGPTKFSDLSTEEFRQTYRNAKFPERPTEQATIPKIKAPDSVDWREKGAVTPVKNQGQCGSCWSFSTTGNIEGQWFIKKGQLISLSEQELVDCDKVDQGCNGGLPSDAYKEIMRLGGLVKETDYPYTAKDGTCKLDTSQIVVTISGQQAISKNEEEMATWCAANGPISIGINAAAMQFYTGGVSHPWSFLCNPSSLDHGVLIVGYGSDNKGTPYWIVKNSWGPDWGEKGYYLVYRGDGTCGLNRMCTSANV